MPALSFGLGIPAGPEPGFDPVAYGRRAEELGFDFLSHGKNIGRFIHSLP